MESPTPDLTYAPARPPIRTGKTHGARSGSGNRLVEVVQFGDIGERGVDATHASHRDLVLREEHVGAALQSQSANLTNHEPPTRAAIADTSVTRSRGTVARSRHLEARRVRAEQRRSRSILDEPANASVRERWPRRRSRRLRKANEGMRASASTTCAIRAPRSSSPPVDRSKR